MPVRFITGPFMTNYCRTCASSQHRLLVFFVYVSGDQSPFECWFIALGRCDGGMRGDTDILNMSDGSYMENHFLNSCRESS
jgi:hypothetical protein